MGSQPHHDPDWLRENYWDKNLSTREVADKAGVSSPTILKWMKRFDIDRRDRIQQNKVDLSDEALNYLQGHILGDGSLTNYRGKSALFAFSNKHREVVEWAKSRLNDYNIKVAPEGIVSKEGGFGTTVFAFRTVSYPEFAPIRNRWYPDGHKSLPQDFELTPMSLRQLYIGDGSLSGNSVSIATNWYTSNEVDWLINELSNLGVSSYKNEVCAGQYRIYIPSDESPSFFDVIGDLPDGLRPYSYKWP